MGKIRSCLVFKHLSFESFGTTQDSSKYHIKRNRGFVTPPANSQCNALTNSLQRCTVAKQYKAILSSDWHSFPTFYSTAQACHDVHTPRKKKSKQMQWRATLARKPLGDIDIDILILTNIIKLDQVCRPQKCPKCFRGFSVAVFVLELFQITTAKSLSQKSTASI